MRPGGEAPRRSSDRQSAMLEAQSPMMNILVVDDDRCTLSLVRALLEPLGYHVLTVADGAAALEVLRTNPQCRMVISDWDMPSMDGLDLCRAIRAADYGGYVYFVLLTGHSEREHRLKALEAGADDFVSKPFDRAELLVRVRGAERILSIETRDVALFALAKLAESRDVETGAHLERVQRYSGIIARWLSGRDAYRRHIDAEYVRLIELTSALHDIGKVGIPDTVLLKPGRLSDGEFEIMKTHTVIGAQNLEAAVNRFPNARYLRMARDIALTHHERFDGSGYPGRLSGPDIPLCGRIVALADVYDALCTKRCYKSAFAHTVARSIIVQESGKHFDPDVVDAFVATEEQFVEVHCRFTGATADAALAAVLAA